jgi:RES domain-containing protein
VSYGQTVRRGGAYNRVVEPRWADPLDTSHSKAQGGRWNRPGAFGALHLNRDLATARLQVRHKLGGMPYAVEDLDPQEQHHLIEVEVDQCEALDCVTASGLKAVGLTNPYPLDDDGDPVTHAVCQRIGEAAYAAGLPGVACRPAAAGAISSNEELAVFDHHAGLVRQTARRSFADWYLGAAAAGRLPPPWAGRSR